MEIPFNKPYLTGLEFEYMKDATKRGKISGNGFYTKKCHRFFQEKYNFRKCLLTTSCTDALEMAAILIGIKEGDEVIIPSYTFVSTANAFVLRGAKIIFADSRQDHPGFDERHIEHLITPKTKAIVPVHYAGVACDMDSIMNIAKKHNIYVIEDAAQALNSFYIGSDGIKKALGSIGHLAAFSFHETKNIICGEGGMLVVNDQEFIERAEIIWEKGTNRSAFFRGEIDKYGWVDIGSSFLPSDLNAAFLWAQLESLDSIQSKRIGIWETYNTSLKDLPKILNIRLPKIPDYATNNAHMYYLVCNSPEQQRKLLQHLKTNGVLAVFHYLSLHKSEFYRNRYVGRDLPRCDFYSEQLLRLPLFPNLTKENLEYILQVIHTYRD